MSGVIAALIGSMGLPPLAVSASNVSASDGGASPFGTVTTTAGDTATTGSGGVPGYTYAWTYVSGSVSFDVINPALQNPQWSGTISDGLPQTAVWRVTITDSIANTATFDIDVSLEWFNLG